MSLRNFHLVFVTVCSLLFAFLTLWSFLLSDEKSTLTRTIGITGIYLPASAQIGFTIAGANAATLSASGFAIPVGVSGGTF